MDEQKANLPLSAKVLHFGMQEDDFVIWVDTDTEAPTKQRRFFVVGTGHPIPGRATYCGTVMDGPFVWHLFEGKF